MDKISVIVPIYQGEKYINGLILQIENCVKKIPDVYAELVLSNDDPKRRITIQCPFLYLHVVVLNTDQNRGIHGARVRGLNHSRGDYILFLDQDDEIDENFFEKQLSLIQDNDAIVCNALSGGRIKYNVDRPLCKAISRLCMVREGNMILSPGQVLIRREAIPDVWKENILSNNGADDWLLWICMHAAGKKFALNKEVLFKRTLHYSNASFDSLEMEKSEKEVLSVIQKNRILEEDELFEISKLIPQLQIKRVKENERWKKQFLLLHAWMNLKQNNISICKDFGENGIKNVAIYGYSYLGINLNFEIEKASISVDFYIDKNAEYIVSDKPIYKLEDDFGNVDAVVISLLREYNMNLEENIKKRMESRIIWLEDMISFMR